MFLFQCLTFVLVSAPIAPFISPGSLQRFSLAVGMSRRYFLRACVCRFPCICVTARISRWRFSRIASRLTAPRSLFCFRCFHFYICIVNILDKEPSVRNVVCFLINKPTCIGYNLFNDFIKYQTNTTHYFYDLLYIYIIYRDIDIYIYIYVCLNYCHFI